MGEGLCRRLLTCCTCHLVMDLGFWKRAAQPHCVSHSPFPVCLHVLHSANALEEMTALK